MPRLVIVQPYIPAYRVPFFTSLVARLADDGVECLVAHGTPEGQQSQRGDSVADTPEWAVETATSGVHIGGRWLRTYRATSHIREADAVIVEQSSGALESSWAVARRHQRVGVWGHIASYVAPAGVTSTAIKRWQVRNADHVFAYTPRGARAAIALGADRLKVTVTMNTVETLGLVAERAAITQDEIDTFREIHHLGDGPVLAFIGGLDASKRIGFLVETLDLLWVVRPDVRLVVGGAGSEEHLLDAAVARGQVVSLGVVNSKQKALLGATASLLLMPGRVGLVAVESLALGLPIATTDWPFHAPEMDYLRPGIDCELTPDDPLQYAIAVRRLLEDDETRLRMSAAAASRAGWPSMADMVERYVGGVRRLLA